MKSFIPWIGGKTLLAKKIISEFPENFGRYIEVFGGGASVLFAAEKHAKIEVYNDMNGKLVNLFRCLKYHRGEPEREIDGYVNSREVFYDLRERLKCRGFTDIQRASMFFTLIKLSFGANCKDYCCCTRTLDTSRFAQVSERIKNVVIENRDFKELINQYDRPDAFFYCDPPYYRSEKCYTNTFII